MKVLTIKQPWATLICEGYKEYEFRTWKTKMRGEFLIHAGKSVDKEAMQRFKHLNLEYPKGKIIAKAKLTDCVEVTEEFAKKMYQKDKLVYKTIAKSYGIDNLEKNDWKGYAFKLEDVKKIKEREINGKLSFWNYEIKEEIC